MKAVTNRVMTVQYPYHHFALFEGTGLSMDLLETSSNGNSSFLFRHNPNYQNVQKMFWTAVDSLNPENVMDLVRRHPYHVDSLIQVRRGGGVGWEDRCQV